MFVRSPRNKSALALDLFIALLPAAAWAVFLYGGRAAILMLLCGVCCALLDFPVQKFICRRTVQDALSPFAFLTGVLTAFWFPVTVPLWIAALAALPVVICRAFFGYFGHRLFSSSVFSAVLMHLAYPQYMQRFTPPYAYFPAFEMNLDPALVEYYRVRTPLGLLQGGKLYEDGTIPQLYGFASGAIGAVGVACLLLGGVWLLVRRLLSLSATGAYALTILVLAMAFAPEDAEMLGYAWLYLLSGGITLVGVFALNDPATLPRTEGGKALFGGIAGVLTVVFRDTFGGEGAMAAVLAVGLLSPLLERVTRPHNYYASRKKKAPDTTAAEPAGEAS